MESIMASVGSIMASVGSIMASVGSGVAVGCGVAVGSSLQAATTRSISPTIPRNSPIVLEPVYLLFICICLLVNFKVRIGPGTGETGEFGIGLFPSVRRYDSDTSFWAVHLLSSEFTVPSAVGSHLMLPARRSTARCNASGYLGMASELASETAETAPSFGSTCWGSGRDT